MEKIGDLLRSLLYTFPMTRLQIHMPRWMDALENDNPVKRELYQTLLEKAERIQNLGQAEDILSGIGELEQVQDFSLKGMDRSDGTVICTIALPQRVKYDILSSRAGIPIENDGQLLSLLTELSGIKMEYDKISAALSSVKATGYGVVMPTAEEMKLETPEIIKKGSSFGVKLKAGAPSIHMVRVDIDTEISPIVGDEKQSRDLIAYLSGEDPEKLWKAIFLGNPFMI